MIIEEHNLFHPVQSNSGSTTPTHSLPSYDLSAPTRNEESRILQPTHSLPTHSVSTTPSSSQTPLLTPDLSTSPTHIPPTIPPSPSSSDTHSSLPDESLSSIRPINTSPSPTSQITPPPPINPPRRSDRVRKFPRHLYDFAASIELDLLPPELQSDNLTFKQVHTEPRWQAAMQAEIDSIHENQT